MNVEGLTDLFISKQRAGTRGELRRAKLLLRVSLLTSLFSATYLFLSIGFDFKIGIQLMIFNVIGFLLLPILLRTKVPTNIIGNLYVFVGGSAVVILAFSSGGIHSAIYPWIIAIPILALLVVNRKSALVWGAISFLVMLAIGLIAILGFEIENQFDPYNEALWITVVQPGLLLIIFLVAYIFQSTQTNALHKLAKQNSILVDQKNTIASQKEELTALIDDKNHIIRMMAHDLRSPLKNMQGLLKLLVHENNDDRKAEINRLVVQSSLSAENLVNRILEMDRSEDGSAKSNISHLDIMDLLQELVENIQELANQKQINIDLINSAKRTTIEADSTYIQLIFENLLSNAIKFSKEGTNVTIQIAESGQNLQVAVIDEGPGISSSDEEKLFQKFSKLSARPTGGESSTGLGLSLVKRYAELSNGRVWYEGNPIRRGAIFKVEFPLSN